MSATAKARKDLAHRPAYVVTVLPEVPEKGRPVTDEETQGQRLIWDGHNPLGLGYPFEWALERTDTGIRVRHLSGPGGVAVENAVAEVSFADLEEDPFIALSKVVGAGTKRAPCLMVYPVIGSPEETSGERILPPLNILQPVPATADDRLFGRTLMQVLIGGAITTLALYLIPVKRSNVDELIPPQYAKLLLKPTPRKETQPEKKEAGKEQTRERNVVKAFQSKAVQASVKKIFKLGSVSSLTKSALTEGLGSKGALDKVFGSKGSTAPLRALDSSILNPKGPKVETMGGGKAGSYGKAEVAAIAGQGNFQLAIDPGSIAVADGLDKEEVGKAIRQHVSEIRYCYETALVRNPSLEGKLVVTFVIGAEGSVKSATNQETHADAGLVKCILDRLSKWKFPKPRRGLEVEVSYPFIFKSIGG
jgi:outer membrane biosynthesis protein TonB